METGVVTPFVPTPCPAVASIRRSGINGNTKFATSCLLRPWRMSLLFVEVELMETSEYLSDTQLCVQSLLFVEVELMETGRTTDLIIVRHDMSLLFVEVELMETPNQFVLNTFITSLLFVEVELMETTTRKPTTAVLFRKSLLFVEVELMETLHYPEL